MISPALSRRQLIARGLLFGSTALTLPILSGCGGGAGETLATPAAAAPPVPVVPGPTVTRTDWRPLRIGAGGFVTGLDIADDGTRVAWCDTYGAYLRAKDASEWKLILTSTGLPAGEWGHEIGTQMGVYAMAISPTDSNRIYMAFNGFIFKSVDKGTTFTKTSLAKTEMDPNDDYRLMGRRIAVDPVNPDVVYFGTAKNGLWVTVNGGTDWKAVTDVPGATTAAGIAVAFDRNSTKSGGRTSIVYASSTGNGVYASRDAGATFSRMAGSPTSHNHMVVGPDSILWVAEATGGGNNVRRYSGGVWNSFDFNSGISWHSIMVDPADPKHIVLGASGALNSSSNGGTTWTGPMYRNWPAGAGNLVATDIPWLAWTYTPGTSAGDMMFDPTQINTIVFAEGLGVWTTNPPRTWGPYDWTSQSRGIEQMVTTQIITPPGGTPIYLSWDRPIFKIDNPDVFPATHGPNRKNSIIMGWGGDYASSDPRTIVAIVNYWGIDESAFSSDGGTTWNKFASVPGDVQAGKIGGCIAASSADNFIWIPSNNSNPWVTVDQGKNWSQISISGIPTTGDAGWSWAYYLNRQIVCADRVTPNTFYMYNYRGESIGLYKSTNKGLDWTRVYSSEIAQFSTFNAKLASVPGKAGHLFFTSGPQSGSIPSSTKFMRSADAGAMWTAVANVLEVHAFGFGKAANNSSYPAIFIAGYVNGVWGLWRSDDDAVGWVKIGDYPLGVFDRIVTVAGDMDRFGRAYVGFSGAGAAYSELITVAG